AEVAGAHPLIAPDSARATSACQGSSGICRRNMRSSSLCKVESSALMANGGITRGAVDVGKRAGPTEGLARSAETTHTPETGSGRVGAECALAAETAGTLAGRWRRGIAAWPAWQAVES